MNAGYCTSCFAKETHDLSPLGPSPNNLAMRTYVKITIPATSNLFLLIHPLLSSPTARPPSTTAPAIGWLPLGLRSAMPGAHAWLEPAGTAGSVTFPVAGSILFSFIHFQFSRSSSGHSLLNFAPPSPALIFPFCTPLPLSVHDPPPVLFHQRVRAVAHLRSASVALIEPVVISSLVMKLRRPIRMVDTSHAGLKLFGWKSEIERQSRVDGWKRPEGVCMRMAGGAKG
jgi:hypothetical protein